MQSWQRSVEGLCDGSWTVADMDNFAGGPSTPSKSRVCNMYARSVSTDIPAKHPIERCRDNVPNGRGFIARERVQPCDRWCKGANIKGPTITSTVESEREVIPILVPPNLVGGAEEQTVVQRSRTSA